MCLVVFVFSIFFVLVVCIIGRVEEEFFFSLGDDFGDVLGDDFGEYEECFFSGW